MEVKSKTEVKYPTWTYVPSYQIDFIYSNNTYSGYIEGMPSIENGHNESVVKRMIKQSKLLNPYMEPFVYTGNLDTTKVYPYRCSIANINNLDKHMMLIWFDDGKTDIIESLEAIIDDIDFEKNSEEFYL